MVEGIRTCLILLAVAAAVTALARRLAVPSPILLVITGLLLGFVPHAPRISLNPDLVLLLFLPPLVYSTAVYTSWHEFKQNLRPITLLAVGCVLFTMLAVAVAAHWLIPGIPWSVAFVLGAIVSPPDEVAAIAIFERLGIPRRIVAVLEGEGLVNDATALVAYRFAVAAVVGGSFSLWKAPLEFAAVVVGEILWGIVVGWAAVALRKRISDSDVEICLSLLTPFAAYLPAEHLGGSGVLATVVVGLYIGIRAPSFIPAETRLTGYAFWQMVVFLLNSLLFLLTGLQLRAIAQGIKAAVAPGQLILYAGLMSLVVIAVRFVWVFPATYVPRWLSPALARRDPAPPERHVFFVAFTGMRGAISLAAALAIPLTAGDKPFPFRNLILFLTYGVILATLVAQGLSLPWFIKKFGADADGAAEMEDEHRRELSARMEVARAGLRRADELARDAGVSRSIVAAVHRRMEDRIRRLGRLRGRRERDLAKSLAHEIDYLKHVLDAERRHAIDMRDRGAIPDEVLHRIERDLDLDEERLASGSVEQED